MIVRLPEVADRAAALAGLREIFFLSTDRAFAGEEERQRFLATWAGWYLEAAVDDVLLWVEGERVVGYLTGCRDSAGAAPLFDRVPGYAVFADLFRRFPAHLHVNVHPDRRGAGIGGALVDTFAHACGSGLHVVTGVGARNAAFYRRRGFSFAEARGPRLFLGRDAAA